MTNPTRNLEMLQSISAQAAHGIDFRLGIWTHVYHWGPASQPNYTIEGLTSDNHAVYSRDALAASLKACPNISGITLRTPQGPFTELRREGSCNTRSFCSWD